MSSKKRLFQVVFKDNILILILIGLIIFGSNVSRTFLTIRNIQNILINVSIVGLLAIGQTFVMLVKEIDMSVGSLMAFSPILAVMFTKWVLKPFGINVIVGGNYVAVGMWIILLLIILISIGIGILNGLIRVKTRVPSLIVTLGMLYALRGLSYVISGGHPIYFNRLKNFNWFGTKIITVFPFCFLLFIVIAVIGILVLKYTKIGYRIYSTGGNEKAAVYSGINTGKWKIFAFAISGFCAALATIIYSSRFESVEAIQATGYELTSIAIVVIGGTTLEGGRGTMTGTVIACFLLGILINIISLMGLVVWYQNIFIGFIIISALFAYLRGGKTNTILENQ